MYWEWRRVSLTMESCSADRDAYGGNPSEPILRFGPVVNDADILDMRTDD